MRTTLVLLLILCVACYGQSEYSSFVCTCQCCFNGLCSSVWNESFTTANCDECNVDVCSPLVHGTCLGLVSGSCSSRQTPFGVASIIIFTLSVFVLLIIALFRTRVNAFQRIHDSANRFKLHRRRKMLDQKNHR